VKLPSPAGHNSSSSTPHSENVPTLHLCFNQVLRSMNASPKVPHTSEKMNAKDQEKDCRVIPYALPPLTQSLRYRRGKNCISGKEHETHCRPPLFHTELKTQRQLSQVPLWMQQPSGLYLSWLNPSVDQPPPAMQMGDQRIVAESTVGQQFQACCLFGMFLPIGFTWIWVCQKCISNPQRFLIWCYLIPKQSM